MVSDIYQGPMEEGRSVVFSTISPQELKSGRGAGTDKDYPIFSHPARLPTCHKTHVLIYKLMNHMLKVVWTKQYSSSKLTSQNKSHINTQ